MEQHPLVYDFRILSYLLLLYFIISCIKDDFETCGVCIDEIKMKFLFIFFGSLQYHYYIPSYFTQHRDHQPQPQCLKNLISLI